ncbi:hypothetical protein FB451DRAFT_1095826 [Mycena latifolia]|nr:hypothetical protein FB451DRAFT_1095826 [Mycena latifolia]
MHRTTSLVALVNTPSSTARAGQNQIYEQLIAESESKIADIDSQMQDLQCLRSQEQRNIVLWRNLIAPINALPTELLVEIFLFSLPLQYFAERDNNTIIRLSQVCHRWREVAHSTPFFWAEFHIKIEEDSPSDAYIAGMKAWLDRSLNLPVTLWFSSEFVAADLSALANAIIPSLGRRVKELHLNLASFASLHPLFAHSLDSLEILNIRAYWPEQDIRIPTIDLCILAPRLRSIKLDLDYLDGFIVPWSQLTNIHIYEVPSACLEMLLQCSNLEVASVWTADWRWAHLTNAATHPVTVLPNLRSLSFVVGIVDDDDDDDRAGNIEQFFRPLALPALTSLAMDLEGASTVDFSHFQLQSPNLQDIALRDSTISSEGLISLLRCAPAVRSLRLFACSNCIDDSFLRALQFDDTDTDPVAPLLENLDLDEIGDNFEETSLETMIRSRCEWYPAGQQTPFAGSMPEIARLKTVKISCGERGRNQGRLATLQARMQDFAETIHIY